MKESKKRNWLWYAKNYNYIILLPDDPIKKIWDLFTTLILLIVFFLTPYRIAFVNDETVYWIVIDSLIDFSFLIDILVTFFSAFYSSEYILIDKWSKICFSYLRGWFLIDVLSIFPFNYLLGSGDYGTLAKLTWFQWLYWFVKIFWLMRLFKGVKNWGNFLSILKRYLNISVAAERLLIFIFIFILLVHNCTCLWVLIGMIEDAPDSWIY